MIDLLRREVELRISPNAQKQMEKAEESVNSEWMDVADWIQKHIIHEYNITLGRSNGLVISVHDLRLAALRHPEIAFWVKHNRAREGKELLLLSRFILFIYLTPVLYFLTLYFSKRNSSCWR